MSRRLGDRDTQYDLWRPNPVADEADFLDNETFARKKEEMQQAFAANAIDFGLGSGPGMGYASKGVPARGVAALALEPRNMALVVPRDGPVKTVADLKGRRVGVSTAGSLTDWLVHEASRLQGWGDDGIESVGISPRGILQSSIGALACATIKFSSRSAVR